MNRRKKADEALYKKTRPQAIERDQGLCVLCGAMASEVHHILFRGRGGLSNLDNLACLCRECHEMAHGPQAAEVMKVLKERISK